MSRLQHGIHEVATNAFVTSQQRDGRPASCVGMVEARPVFRSLKVIGIAPVLDEEKKIGEVVRRVPRDVVDEMLVVDDGCTDRSPQVARELGANVLPMGRKCGVGAGLRAGYQYAVEHGYDVAVVMAGNNKDSPEEIPLLLEPIAE